MSNPNEMRKLLAIMRGKKPVNENVNEAKMSMRDMLGKMRKLKKKNLKEEPQFKQTTTLDQREEENKMKQYFAQNNVNVEFDDLEVYDNGVFWSGTIDGQLQWVFKVTPDEKTSGVKVDYLEGFDSQDPENEEVIKKLELYYNDFYKYWRDNELQDND